MVDIADAEKLAERCANLHDKVRDILQQEPMHIRINVLLASLFGATDGAPHQTWAPFLANFLVLLAQRDGVYIGVSAVGDEKEGSEEGEQETLH